MNIVKCRTREPGLRPRRTKLEIPGWAGEREPRADGSHEYVWHCLPFSEGAQYGIELFYPYQNELHVTTRDGRLIFDGDFGPPPDDDLQWPPFRTFGDKFYTYQILLDLKVGEGLAIRTEPHPRFYANSTNTVPIAVPALLRNWWPMMFFIVFKSPAEGTTHIFRPGEPFAQVIVVPEESGLWWKKWVKKNAQNGNCRHGASMPVDPHYRQKHTGLRHRTPCSTGLIETSFERPRLRSKKVDAAGRWPCRIRTQ